MLQRVSILSMSWFFLSKHECVRRRIFFKPQQFFRLVEKMLLRRVNPKRKLWTREKVKHAVYRSLPTERLLKGTAINTQKATAWSGTVWNDWTNKKNSIPFSQNERDHFVVVSDSNLRYAVYSFVLWFWPSTFVHNKSRGICSIIFPSYQQSRHQLFRQ